MKEALAMTRGGKLAMTHGRGARESCDRVMARSALGDEAISTWRVLGKGVA
jgi:hypothetical protein